MNKLRTFAVVWLVASGCAQAGLEEPELHESFDESELEYVRDGDMVIPRRINGEALLVTAVRKPQTIYLDFDGATIQRGGWAQNNAQASTSFIPAIAVATIPAFDATPWGVDRAAVIAAIVAGVREDFTGFDVTVTTTRPSAGDYTMVVMGGTAADAGLSGPIGVAPFDASNWNSSDVAFVFTHDMRFYDTRHVAWTVAHEVGHSYGLHHIQPINDIMNPVIHHDPLVWGEGPYPDNTGFQRDLDVLATVLVDPNAPMPPCGGLESGAILQHGDFVMSCDGRFQLIQQPDGNLVLYQGAQPLWASNTWNTAGQRAAMQADGNLVVYDPTTALWSTGTHGHPGARLALHDTGELRILEGTQQLWTSGTCCH